LIDLPPTGTFPVFVIVFGGHGSFLSKAVLGFRFLAFSCQLAAYKKKIAWEWKFGG
jgi:hypothetical protein